MHRFYLPPSECQGKSLTLAGREAHHALHVLRVQSGEQVVVLDGIGHELICEIENHARDRVQLKVIKANRASPLPCQLTLLQAVPKGKLIESIIQKATELGVSRIVPILSERVTTKLDDENAAQKAEK